MDVNHHECAPGAHDRSLPDDHPENCPLCGGKVRFGRCRDCGEFETEVPVADDGLMGCADCRRPLFWCENDRQWHHVDPEAECFLAPAWGENHGG
jgi:hypothetical protein